MTTTRYLTIDDYELLSHESGRFELVDGVLHEVAPPGEDHSDVTRELIWELEQFVRATGIEKLFIEAAFAIERDPGTVLIPDIAFLRSDRLEPDRDTWKSVRTRPDLAVEIVSPTDRAGEINAKVRRYLQAGVEMVWVVNPRQRTITVFRPDAATETLAGDDILSGDPVLPGFHIPVARCFRR
jgi:Uma2 family endonuclease